MNIITENPYRTLGVYCGATTREIQKQISVIKRYAEIGKQAKLPTDFEFLGGISRDNEKISDAANKIEQAKNKVLYAFFWFQNSTRIDETALEYLSRNETEKAIEIWSKLIDLNTLEVKSKNYSAFLNLSTVLMELGILNEDSQSLLLGIKYKGLLVSSELFNDFVKLVAGENVILNCEIVSDEVTSEILKSVQNARITIPSKHLLEAFTTFSDRVVQNFKRKYTEEPIRVIESSISFTRENREEKPGNANVVGEKLYKEIKSHLTFLGETLGANSIQYKSLANKSAQEILQCSIDFFNKHRDDSNYDPGEDALKLAKIAKSIAFPGTTLNRINENIENIQEWVNEAPARKIQDKVKAEMAYITEKLLRFRDLPNTISNARELVNSCMPHLREMKLKLGQSNELYIKMSTVVAGNTQGMVISVVNAAMEKRNKYVEYSNSPFLLLNNNSLFNPRSSPFDYLGDVDGEIGALLKKKLVPPPLYTIEELTSVVDAAWTVTVNLGNLDMDSQQRQHYEKNKEVLKSIAGQLGIKTYKAVVFDGAKSVGQQVISSTTRSSKSSSSGGCYIATMAYGNYNHPQVLTLRIYRDEVLNQSVIGRLLIKLYYFISPFLVTILSDMSIINHLIRTALDKFIQTIKSN
jgi:uncharacterized protein YutE (UPF0331/DUF86 family)